MAWRRRAEQANQGARKPTLRRKQPRQPQGGVGGARQFGQRPATRPLSTHAPPSAEDFRELRRAELSLPSQSAG
jgi:hypothetical protein